MSGVEIGATISEIRSRAGSNIIYELGLNEKTVGNSVYRVLDPSDVTAEYIGETPFVDDEGETFRPTITKTGKGILRYDLTGAVDSSKVQIVVSETLFPVAQAIDNAYIIYIEYTDGSNYLVVNSEDADGVATDCGSVVHLTSLVG